MKLNLDCVRDILLTIEEISAPSKIFIYEHDPSAFPLLKKYTDDEVVYHLQQCSMSGLILNCRNFNDYLSVSDLTPDGHEFVGMIRNNSFWNRAQNALLKGGGVCTLSLLKEFVKIAIPKLIAEGLKFL